MIKTTSVRQKREILLDGPEGNAFMLLSLAHNLAKQLNLDWEPIKTKMTSGDYENLIATFDEYFGDHIDLVRSNDEEEEEDWDDNFGGEDD
jgi:hypothetical protein